MELCLLYTSVRVRQAITYAMNRQEFVDTIVEGRGEVASSFIAKTLPGWNEEVQPYPQDLEKAKELLAEAGYGDGLDLKMYVSGDVKMCIRDRAVGYDTYLKEFAAFRRIRPEEFFDIASQIEESAAGFSRCV